jgi:hypothetical protein
MKALCEALQQRPGHRILPVVFDAGGPMGSMDQRRATADGRDREVDALSGYGRTSSPAWKAPTGGLAVLALTSAA